MELSNIYPPGNIPGPTLGKPENHRLKKGHGLGYVGYGRIFPGGYLHFTFNFKPNAVYTLENSHGTTNQPIEKDHHLPFTSIFVFKIIPNIDLGKL